MTPGMPRLLLQSQSGPRYRKHLEAMRVHSVEGSRHQKILEAFKVNPGLGNVVLPEHGLDCLHVAVFNFNSQLPNYFLFVNRFILFVVDNTEHLQQTLISHVVFLRQHGHQEVRITHLVVFVER